METHLYDEVLGMVCGLVMQKGRKRLFSIFIIILWLYIESILESFLELAFNLTNLALVTAESFSEIVGSDYLRAGSLLYGSDTSWCYLIW